MQIDLTDSTKKASATVLKLAAPILSENVLFMVVGVVSTILVGRIGPAAISSVGLINSIIAFSTVVFVAFSTGSTVLVARLIGEDDAAKAKDAVILSSLAVLIMSFVITSLTYVFAGNIVELLFGAAEEDVKQGAVCYLLIVLYTFPLFMINTVVSGCLRGAGDTKTPMIIGYVVNIVNVILGVILIYGVHIGGFEFEGMGLTGAAIAVAISRGIGGVISIAVLFKPKSVISLLGVKKINLDIDLFKRILHIGVPASVEQVIMQGSHLGLQTIISGMGTSSMAIFQIAMSINSIIFIPAWTFGLASVTLVGQTLGLRRADLSEKFVRACLRYGLLLTTVITTIIFIFARPIISIYTNDMEIINAGVTSIRIFCIGQPFLAIAMVYSNSLRAAGDVYYVMVTTLIGTWLFRLALSYLLAITLQVGILGIWIAFSADFIIRSLLYAMRFRRGHWKHIKV